MRLLHIADLHLGRKTADDPFGAIRMKSLRRLIDKAPTLEVDAILVAGDVFHSPKVNASVARMAARAFDAAIDVKGSRLPVIVIPGNHDPAEATDLWAEFTGELCEDSAVQLALQPTVFELSGGQLLVEAYPCQNRYSPEAPWAERVTLPDNVSAASRVVVAHGTLQGGPVPDGETDAYPFTSTEVAALGADYVALGHFHGIYPPWEGSEELERMVCYSGTHEPDQFDSDSGWGLIVDVRPGGPATVRRASVGISRWLSVDIQQPSDLDKLKRLLHEIENDGDPQRYKIRVRTDRRAGLSSMDATQLEQIEAGLCALGARVEMQGEAQAFVDVDSLNLESLPAGAIRETLLSLQSELRRDTDTERQNVIRAAIQLGWHQMQEVK